MYVTRDIIGPQAQSATHLGFKHTMSGVSNFKLRVFVVGYISHQLWERSTYLKIENVISYKRVIQIQTWAA